KLSCNVKFLSGIGAAKLIERHGFEAVDAYLPKRFDVQSGELKRSFRWLLGYYTYYKKCRVAAAGFLSQNSGLVVSDEDFASIAEGQLLQRKTILITDITETNFTSGPASIIEKKMNERMHRLMDACERVIIPDTGTDSGNRTHVGPIVREPS